MNFKKLAKGYEKNALLALKGFIRINSVYDEKTVAEDAPYGLGVKKALAYFGKLGSDNGFAVKDVDGRAVELSYGEEGPLIGIYGHADTVPFGEKWTKSPLEGKIEDGKVFGRGAIDDKGPLLATFYAAKLLKDNGLIKGYRLKIVAGGDEERGSSCLDYYFNSWNGEKATFGFTPDSDFPLIYAEKAMYGLLMSKVCSLDPIIAIDGGTVPNAVNESALITIKKDPSLEKAIEGDGDFENLSNDVVTIIKAKGVSAHGSTPEKGKNALVKAFKVLGAHYKNEFLANLSAIIASSNGEHWGGSATSRELGPTTYNYGVVKYDGKVLKLTLDMRFGEEIEADKLVDLLSVKSEMSIVKLSSHDHLLFDKKSPLVKTLMKAYRKETHDFFSKPLAIGGGTYAKEAVNTVAFGACWKGNSCNMHGADEYIPVADFLKDIAVYARAIGLLGKEAK